MTTRAFGVALAFVLSLISAVPATAGMLYKFDGLVQSVTGTSPFGSPAVGDTISGTFTLAGTPTLQIYYPIDSAGWAPVREFISVPRRV